MSAEEGKRETARLGAEEGKRGRVMGEWADGEGIEFR